MHLQNLKTTPEVEEVVNTCVECGFCEPACPSQDLTTTPRQRIVLRREMARQAEGSPVARVLAEEFEYDGLETCAADGSCVLACPLSIDTGKLVKELRAKQHSRGEDGLALRAAKHWGAVETASRAGLRAGPLAEAFGGGALPRPAQPLPRTTSRDGAAAVYFPSCTNRIMGASKKASPGPSLADATVAVSERAGMPVWIPPDVGGSCCGVPWSSKGHREGHAWMARQTFEKLWRWSDEGALPVVSDASSCTLGLTTETLAALPEDVQERHGMLEILDSVEWLERLLPNLDVDRKLGRVAIHPTCATRHLGLAARFSALAAEIADEVAVPAAARCCGFAGDRGMLHPELTASATAAQAAELR